MTEHQIWRPKGLTFTEYLLDEFTDPRRFRSGKVPLRALHNAVLPRSDPREYIVYKVYTSRDVSQLDRSFVFQTCAMSSREDENDGQTSPSRQRKDETLDELKDYFNAKFRSLKRELYRDVGESESKKAKHEKSVQFKYESNQKV